MNVTKNNIVWRFGAFFSNMRQKPLIFHGVKMGCLPDVWVEVYVTRWEDEIGWGVADQDLVDGIDVGVPVHPQVGAQEGVTGRVVLHSLKENNNRF